ncbi:MAG TPA: hypothetical protein VMH26_17040 [Burkholderiales bacterium]|nr:hypothetical protein [Burkholderiales bacterium]
MRWKFYTPGERPEEDAQRAVVIGRIDAWWRAFEARAQDLDRLFNNQSEWDLVAWMEQHLQSIDARLMWEFGPGSSGGHRLVITPEADHELRPLVDEILKRAPTLSGWSFFAHRQPESVEHMSSTIKSRTGVEPAFTGVALTPGEFNRVDLLFQFPQPFLDSKLGIARSQTFLAALSLLGEELLTDWVGRLDAAAEVAQPLPPGAVRRAFVTLAAGQRSGVPAQPFLDRLESLAWTEVDLKPKKQEDYFHRYDLGAAVTCAPDLWRNAHSNQLFWSGRFSRSGETFCYLKIDRGRPLRRSAVGKRIKSENVLNQALRPQRLGCVIGGGSGRRYDYIDLALIDVPAAVEVIRSVLQRGGLATRRAWMQFFDNILGAEWIGLWPDSPAPPMAPG